jgi:hypothetical protein
LTGAIRVLQQLQIADIVLSIQPGELEWAFEPASRYEPFIVAGRASDVDVSVIWQPFGTSNLGSEVFSARDMPGRFPPNWRLYLADDGEWRLRVNASAYPVFRERIAVFEPNFRRGRVYVDLQHRDLELQPYPLSGPLDRVLFVNIVTHGLGIMLHACGVVLDGKGYIFAGPSNAGKTTLARLWHEFSEGTILGDECLILRRRGNGFWAYGTPWVGEAGLFAPDGVPVEALFFIHHDNVNKLRPIAPQAGVMQLLAQSLLTPYDGFAIESGLDLCLDLVHTLPLFEFGFVPEASAVRMIQDSRVHGRIVGL